MNKINEKSKALFLTIAGFINYICIYVVCKQKIVVVLVVLFSCLIVLARTSSITLNRGW